MHVMQVAFTIAEFGVNGRIGEAKQIFFMTGKADAIRALFVGNIEAGRIAPFEHPEVI